MTQFLVLACIRKLAGFCLVLDVKVNVRWDPSEANISDRPIRTHKSLGQSRQDGDGLDNNGEWRIGDIVTYPA